MPECFVSQFNLNLCTANVYRKCVFCLSLFAPGWARANDESEPGQVLLENAGKRGGGAAFHTPCRAPPTARRVPPTSPQEPCCLQSSPTTSCLPPSSLTNRPASGIRVIAPDAELPVPLGGPPGPAPKPRTIGARVSMPPGDFPQSHRTGRCQAVPRLANLATADRGTDR